MTKKFVKLVKFLGTFIIKSPDDASQLLDDHIVMTQSMNFSPFKKPFEERIVNWEKTLRVTQDVLGSVRNFLILSSLAFVVDNSSERVC